MNDITTFRMMIATAALAAFAAVFAGGANAMLQDVEGGGSVPGASAVPTTQPMTIPYLSHGIGVDASQFSGQASPKLTGVHAALTRNREAATTSTVEPMTIPYLSHGIGVDASQFSGQASLGLTGDSGLTRAAAQSRGLTGDSPVGRFPGAGQQATLTSGGSDVDWSSFGVGAGLAALVAAGIAGVWLTTRRRGGVALP